MFGADVAARSRAITELAAPTANWQNGSPNARSNATTSRATKPSPNSPAPTRSSRSGWPSERWNVTTSPATTRARNLPARTRNSSSAGRTHDRTRRCRARRRDCGTRPNQRGTQTAASRNVRSSATMPRGTTRSPKLARTNAETQTAFGGTHGRRDDVARDDAIAEARANERGTQAAAGRTHDRT